ncbi:MAG: hypothetical protein WD118_00695, partial [Phycisphaeraceae bacterium]
SPIMIQPAGVAARRRSYLARIAERYDSAACLLTQTSKGPRDHSKVAGGMQVHPIRDSLTYAACLLSEQDEEPQRRAEAIIDCCLRLQDTDSTSRTYGIWPYLLEEPLEQMRPPDHNWADFCGAQLAVALRMHAERLAPSLRQRVREALGHAAGAIFRRNVAPSYTNIAIMGAGVCAAAGELLDAPWLLAYARKRFAAIVDHVAYHGSFNEYNSPTYTPVAIYECERTHHLVADTDVCNAAERLRQHAWKMIAEHYHAATGQWAGPHSRDYNIVMTPRIAAFLADRTGVAIPLDHRMHEHVSQLGMVDALPPIPAPESCCEAFRERAEPERVVRRRYVRHADADASIWGTTWLSERACLGTVTRHELWVQRRTLLGYWRDDEQRVAVLRLRMLHDGQDFASGYAHHVQAGPRVLSLATLLTNRGDLHPLLDPPADGVFEAGDVRLRYELDAADAQARALPGGRFELRAGLGRAVLHPLPGMWDGQSIRWQLAELDHGVALEAIAYTGPRRPFALADLQPTYFAAGLELLTDADREPLAISPQLHTAAEQITASWALPDEPPDEPLEVAAPLRPIAREWE